MSRLIATIGDRRHLVKSELHNETPGDGMRHLDTWCGIRGWWSESQVNMSDQPACVRCERAAKGDSLHD